MSLVYDACYVEVLPGELERVIVAGGGVGCVGGGGGGVFGFAIRARALAFRAAVLFFFFGCRCVVCC